jgi:hypothetical protein
MERRVEANASLHCLRHWLQTEAEVERRKFWHVRAVRHEGHLGNALQLQLPLGHARTPPADRRTAYVRAQNQSGQLALRG